MSPTGWADKPFEKVIIREEIFSRMNKPFGLELRTYNVIRIGVPHLFAAYWFYLELTGQVPWTIVLFELVVGYIGGLGTTVGCHRYWTHKTFKAKLPLQILLMIMQTISYQYPIHLWCLHHRIHHKYTDTAADPHNSKRGFWFSHIGWLFVPMSPEVEEKMRTVDMSDLERDPIVRFQSRWFFTLVAIFHFIIPISVIHYVWDIPLFYCFAANCRRYVISLHFTCLVNSVAHMWGWKPYDRTISSTENPIVSLLAVGEGWHNYHHAFPWDYKASEFGWRVNASTMFIDMFARIGWVSDMKTVSQKVLRDRLRRTGSKGERECIWGWDDHGISDELRQATIILCPAKRHASTPES